MVGPRQTLRAARRTSVSGYQRVPMASLPGSGDREAKGRGVPRVPSRMSLARPGVPDAGAVECVVWSGLGAVLPSWLDGELVEAPGFQVADVAVGIERRREQHGQ